MRSWRPDYLSKHDDVEADAIGLDECAVLSAGQVLVVLGKPGERRTGWWETVAGSTLWLLGQGCFSGTLSYTLRPRSTGIGWRSALPADR